MSKTSSDPRDHFAMLMEMGFPRRVAENASDATAAGLFDIEPSSELFERTVSACKAAAAMGHGGWNLPSSVHGTELQRFYRQLEDDLHAQGASGDIPALTSITRLVRECRAMIDFVHHTGRRPMTLLDNHNVVVPDWWSTDTGFLAVRDALRKINEAALEVNACPTAVFMVFRPSLNDYREKDLVSIRDAFAGGSEVWLVPYSKAGDCANVGGLFFGDGHAVTLKGRRKTSGAAFSAFEDVEPSSVDLYRDAFRTMETAASTNGRLVLTKKNGLRSLVRKVIEAGEIVRLAA